VMLKTGNIVNKVNPTMWRFLPMIDPTVDVFISRDLDSRFSTRESAAVNEWIKSNKTFHSMRDNPYHNEFMMAGLWGAKTSKINNSMKSYFKKSILSYGTDIIFKRGHDQTFLRTFVYPTIKYDLVSHDSYFCRRFIDSVPFPMKRNNNSDYVGNYIFRPNAIHISRECPIECRPSYGKNWKFC